MCVYVCNAAWELEIAHAHAVISSITCDWKIGTFVRFFCTFKGDYLNDLCVLNTGSNTWTATSVVGELPEPRSDTQVKFFNAYKLHRRCIQPLKPDVFE